jgi:hypothetical protein
MDKKQNEPRAQKIDKKEIKIRGHRRSIKNKKRSHMVNRLKTERTATTDTIETNSSVVGLHPAGR